MIKYRLSIVMLILIVWSCKKQVDPENAVARVYDKYLFEEDIYEQMPENLSKEDSILFRTNYINNWAKEELLLQNANLNIADDNEEIRQLVSNYRKELIIEKYKQALLLKELDTIITDADIDHYYDENSVIFKLNEDLVQLRFVHFNHDLLDQKEVIKRFKANKEEDAKFLEERELEFKSYNFNDSIWVSQASVKQKLPFLADNQVIKKTNFLQKEDSLGVYLVAVKNVLKRNDIAPKSYVVPAIKQMILHKRKLELMRRLEQNIVSDAISKKEFEQYDE